MKDNFLNSNKRNNYNMNYNQMNITCIICNLNGLITNFSMQLIY